MERNTCSSYGKYLPLAAKQIVTPDNQMQLKHRLLCLTNSHDKLRANLSAAEKSGADTQTSYEGLIQDIVNTTDHALGKEVTQLK